MVGTPDFDTILDICEHKYRRIVLAALADQQQPVSVTDLANVIVNHDHHTPPTETIDETVAQIRTKLHHVHLPKLAEAGLVHYDSERRVVEPTATFEQEVPHLSAILTIDSELPTTSRR